MVYSWLCKSVGNGFSILGAEITGYPFWGGKKVNLYLIPCQKEGKKLGVDFRWTKNSNIKDKMIKLFGNNIGDYLYYFEIGNDFLRYIKHNT